MFFKNKIEHKMKSSIHVFMKALNYVMSCHQKNNVQSDRQKNLHKGEQEHRHKNIDLHTRERYFLQVEEAENRKHGIQKT